MARTALAAALGGPALHCPVEMLTTPPKDF